MKKPERLIGFIKYNDIDFPFEFEENTFSIMLYPPTLDVWKEYSDPMRFFDSLNKKVKTPKSISQIELSGLTSEDYQIIFNVQDFSSSYHGFISFRVNWYMCHLTKMQKDRIDGFVITGHDVNLFYPPQIALVSEVEYQADEYVVNKISVSSKEPVVESCGKYRISKQVDVEIDVTAYATHRSDNWVNPIDSTSRMSATLSKPVGIDTIIDAYYNLRQFFEYVAYRKNVEVGDLYLFFKNEKGARDYSGIIVFPNEHKKETHKKVKERIISYHILKDRATMLFTAIKNSELVFQHICDSIDDMRYYPASRIIMIFAAFEREYRNIYGQNSGRSDHYLEVKENVVSLVNEYADSKKGKKRQYAKQLKKYIENRDSSFEANIKNALNDCEEIMTPFVSRGYTGTYQDEVHEISRRMGEARNGIAHSRLDLMFDATHLSDIHVIEGLLYAMRLKNIGLEVLVCQKAINQLHG